MMLMNELAQLLQGYVLSSSSLKDCVEWLSGVDWDASDLDEEEARTLGLFELLATEVSEGLRVEREFWDEAARLVAARTGNVFSRQTFPEISLATGTASTSSPALVVSVPVRESRFWNISPLMALSS